MAFIVLVGAQSLPNNRFWATAKYVLSNLEYLINMLNFGNQGSINGQGWNTQDMTRFPMPKRMKTSKKSTSFLS